jgi:hypothetical protein
MNLLSSTNYNISLIIISSMKKFEDIKMSN